MLSFSYWSSVSKLVLYTTDRETPSDSVGWAGCHRKPELVCNI